MRRPGSPRLGFSILTTSAPSQASASVEVGPASNWVRSTTRTPLRQLRGAKFPLIVWSPPARRYAVIVLRQDTAERRPAEIADFREQPCIELGDDVRPGHP